MDLLAKAFTPSDYDLLYKEDCEAIAKSRNCYVEYPEENQLQLDLDTDEAHERFLRNLTDLEGLDCLGIFDDVVVEERPSRSGLPHRHVTLTFPNKEFTETERVFFQLALCSDPVRERLNAMRHLMGVTHPTRLFRPIDPEIEVVLPEIEEN